jgi:two-component system, response regulator / RNA-binding antiterminator
VTICIPASFVALQHDRCVCWGRSTGDECNLVVRILLADDDAQRAEALTKVLSADPGLTILRPVPGVLLADAVAAQAPDVVLVDLARSDRDTLDGTRGPRPIVLFVDQDDPAFMAEAIGAGVLSYHLPGVPPPDVKPILRSAAAMFRHRADDRRTEQDIVGRAKATLVKERYTAEPGAGRRLREHPRANGQSSKSDEGPPSRAKARQTAKAGGERPS